MAALGWFLRVGERDARRKTKGRGSRRTMEGLATTGAAPSKRAQERRSGPPAARAESAAARTSPMAPCAESPVRSRARGSRHRRAFAVLLRGSLRPPECCVLERPGPAVRLGPVERWPVSMTGMRANREVVAQLTEAEGRAYGASSAQGGGPDRE